jgi:hypothetical protein
MLRKGTSASRESDDDVGAVGGGEVRDDVRQQGSSPPVTRFCAGALDASPAK